MALFGGFLLFVCCCVNNVVLYYWCCRLVLIYFMHSLMWFAFEKMRLHESGGTGAQHLPSGLHPSFTYTSASASQRIIHVEFFPSLFRRKRETDVAEKRCHCSGEKIKQGLWTRFIVAKECSAVSSRVQSWQSRLLAIIIIDTLTLY